MKTWFRRNVYWPIRHAAHRIALRFVIPSLSWDPNDPELLIYDPSDIVSERDLLEGTEFRLWVGCHLGTDTYRVICTEVDGYDDELDVKFVKRQWGKY